MKVLVYIDDKGNGQVAGITDSSEGLPTGFKVFEVEKAALDELYFNGETVTRKPIPPNEGAIWDVDHWVELAPSSGNPINLVPKITADALAATVYKMLHKESPLLAECLRYILAKIEGDTFYQNASLQNLIPLITKFQNESGKDDDGNNNTANTSSES